MTNEGRSGSGGAFNLGLCGGGAGVKRGEHSVDSSRVRCSLRIGIRIHHLRPRGIIVAPLHLRRRRLILFSLGLSRLRRQSHGVGAIHEPGEDYLRLRARSSRVEELGEIICSESTIAAWTTHEASEIRTRGGPISGQPRPLLRILLELLMAIHHN